MKRRIIAGLMIVLVVTLWTGLHSGLAAQREDDAIEPQYTYVMRIGTDLSMENGTVRCYGVGRSRYAETETVVRVTLQKRVIGTTKWFKVCSWSSSESGVKSAVIDERETISRGYDYRVYVSCTIRDSEGVIKETAGKYSTTISYPHS